MMDQQQIDREEQEEDYNYSEEMVADVFRPHFRHYRIEFKPLDAPAYPGMQQDCLEPFNKPQLEFFKKYG